MHLRSTIWAATVAVILTASAGAQADPTKLPHHLNAYEKASNDLVILHHRSIALHKEIEAAAKRRNAALKAIDIALDFVHEGNRELTAAAERVANAVHDADQAYVQSHLDALNARARAEQALAEHLAAE